ncbi:hypothetical protein AAA214_24685, partial [Parabacteroides goldsteinii]|uniref:hypothetical protein n=1 Tax=Parabacteroides goldsteinii TaxID=328812 RepID=UPI0032C1E38E
INGGSRISYVDLTLPKNVDLKFAYYKPPIKYLYKLTSGANLVKFLQVGDIFLYFTMVGKEWGKCGFAIQVQHCKKIKTC